LSIAQVTPLSVLQAAAIASERHGLAQSGFGYSDSKKIIAAPSVRTWSPTVLLGMALRRLNMIDRTGNLAFT
jgi:hypothetical protein